MNDERKYLVLKMVQLAIGEIILGRADEQSGLADESVVSLAQAYGQEFGVTADEVMEVLHTPLSELFRL